ncbi:hypothetical protein N0M98_25045 [Paenibacillus doosanensis]|uniref:Uncharacterized protein n=1 Tax=Paenibacillus konkukensis TaxID=2020716 RepID=A0ABY4RPX8_9BACL|nr:MULTISPECIES: hypothetical protein [Paenibacillus]MCS7463376.1 hypothetical protein [Paenibacillus doosanensis]UQZ84025.1 hypothetical protein SK3146_03237 [Paenibacillus konkukensis]
MAYNDVNIIKDASQQPVPQYLNGVGSAYEPVLGANGATRTMIYDASGNPLFTGANPGLVQLAGGYVGYSTSPKPSIINPVAGVVYSFLELDTKNVYIFDGERWVVI